MTHAPFSIADPRKQIQKKKSGGGDALQEICAEQSVQDKGVEESGLLRALQEICQPQPAFFVGLIAVLTGNALQDDIAASARFS